MYTDYINGEERCRVVARKLIYWVAVTTCVGGVMDATEKTLSVLDAHLSMVS